MVVELRYNSSSATGQPEARKASQDPTYNIPRKPLAEARIHAKVDGPHSSKDITSTPTKRTTSGLQQLILPWTLAAITAAVYAVTVSYALGTTRLRYLSFAKMSPSHSLAVLRTLSEITSLCIFFLINVCAERVMWIYVSGENGAPLATFLALHYGSGVLSWLHLLARNLKGARFLSLLRIISTAAVTAMGVVLLSAVKIQLSFDNETTFPVAAGIGNFDPTYAAAYNLVAATLMTADFSSLLQSREVAWPVPVVGSEAADCAQADSVIDEACGRGYYLHGGYKMVTPWPTSNTSMTSNPIYTIHSVRGIQLDFTELKPGSRFQGSNDCTVFGDKDSAFQLCISQYSTNAINAKYAACPWILRESCLNDTSWLGDTGWAATLTTNARHATVHLSRANLSTVSVTDLSPPVKYSLSAVDMFFVFNTTFRATNSMGNLLYPSEQFIHFLNIYLNLASMSSPTASQASMGLHNLLAMPLYYFQPTYLSPYTVVPSPDSVLTGLPDNQGLYTTASFSTYYYGLTVAPWSIYTYTIVMGVVLCLCLMTLTLSSIPKVANGVPDTTPWPFIDVAAGCRLINHGPSDVPAGTTHSGSETQVNNTSRCAQQIKVTKGFWGKAKVIASVNVKLINDDP